MGAAAAGRLSPRIAFEVVACWSDPDVADWADTGTIASHLSSDAGYTRASHSFGFSPMTRRRLMRPVCGGGMTPARIASSMRLLKRRRRMKDRSIIADETNSNKNNVARKVNR
jgi:hypothetical protein